MDHDFYNMAVKGITLESPIDMKQLKFHKLDAIYLKKYQGAEIDGESWSSFLTSETKRKNELLKVLEVLNYKKIDYLLLKGLSFQKYYPSTLYRYSLDFDFSVSNFEDFLKCADTLFSRGFEYESYPQFSYNQEMRGVIKLIKCLDGGDTLSIEFNIGGFPASDFTWIDYSIISKDSRTMYENEVAINIPSHIANFIIFLAEVNERDVLRVRDALDFKYMIEYIKIEKVSTTLKSLYLYKNVRRVYKYLENLDGGKQENQWFRNIRRKYHTLFLDKNHIIPMIYRNHYTPLRDLSMNYYKRVGEVLIDNDFFINNIKKFELLLDVRKRFYAGILTHFIPINHDKYDSFQWLTEENMDLVETPLGLFLASNFCVHTEVELEKVEELTNF
ncbi:nucleotidyltransferase family protein [Bacillus sp. A301a_S52]|nr:nucleotidyltransferase family protein [Bacillus sp. A301a_S52]